MKKEWVVLQVNTRALRGSDLVYGEFILTNRFAALGTYDLPIPTQDVRIDFAYSYHDQNSYYGDYHYAANQQVYFTNLIWDKKFSYNRHLLIGGTLRYDQLEQTFDGQRLEDGSEDNRFIPGIFAQYDHIFSSAWRGLVGLRVDHYTEHGFIFSPRANLKVSPTDHTTFRINAGTGFRIVNLFTEQHEALTGSRRVVVTENLKPERSYNITANINQIIDIGYSVLNVDFDIWHTYFTNQIIPDYNHAGEIRYSNLNGHSVSRGVSLSAAHNFPGPFMYSMGITLQDVYQKRNGIKEPILFSPGFSGVFSLSYDIESIWMSLDWTGQITGKMKLPEYEGYADQSELYTEQNLKIAKKLNRKLQIYMSVKNLFNYTQENPIIAPDRPFSNDFATDRVFGPMQGRRLLIGIRYELD
ncbi:MAG TPA: TonB-dependent receptor [Balneolaceae bacterium]